MDAISWQLLFEGAWATLWISGIAILFGVSIGLVIAFIRMMKIPVVDTILVLYISLARATPLVTLVLFLFLSLPVVGINLDKSIAAIVALTLNTSAFNAEIWRNAFTHFPKEQKEAAEAVGMQRWTYFRYIMLPQMWIESLPALVNEMSFLIKGSPAIAVIGVVDLTRVTNRISAVTYEPLSPILAAGLLYIVIIGVLLKLQNLAERKAKRLAR
ncbi:amino acid ABC transporter permease [Mangrovibacter plantisponsor]|uniref:Amino acid ABC transporter membrane protein 1 (PAAT family) n=1 Tax=Mangrovibacter plantisponsor TaxID=451513 RepID=A0A317PUQ9_9ENTR|nr:amino acid ABC transporter permease [Mangrovibacter plantisponsor]PWW05948.1 amino acid ABC transporter membrane protein 1 (PAAT family) [Mangrovibacter plantisponsor]